MDGRDPANPRDGPRAPCPGQGLAPPTLTVCPRPGASCVQNGKLDAAHRGPSGLPVIPEGRCCAHATGANSEAVMSQLTPSRAPTLCSHCRWASPRGQEMGRQGEGLAGQGTA